jgi:hypothetical protein
MWVIQLTGLLLRHDLLEDGAAQMAIVPRAQGSLKLFRLRHILISAEVWS